MDAYGYLFKGYAGKVSADYFPSLIGSPDDTTHGNADDAYFERIEISDRHISDITISRWRVWDNGPAGVSDFILAVRGRGGSYYIPKAELEEIAASNQDDETFELLAKLFPIGG